MGKRKKRGVSLGQGLWKTIDPTYPPQDWRFRNGILFKWVSYDNPEQIEAFRAGKKIAYIRLRHGRLTAEYTDGVRKGDTFFEHHFICDGVSTMRHVTPPDDDDNSEKFTFGAFAGHWHRAYWLEKIGQMLEGYLALGGRQR